MKPVKTFASLALVLIMLIANRGFAQEEVLFRLKFLPEKTYTTEMINDMKMEMDFTDTVQRNQILAKGMKLPMHIDMLQQISLTTHTGAATTNKQIPLTISYDKMDVLMKMEGKEIKQPNQLVGMKIKGHAREDGKLNVDEIEGNTSPEIKSAMEKMISQLLKSVQFPDKPMKIGDSFIQELPMVIPIGENSMNMLVKVNYTLKAIKGNQAFFDYAQNINLDLTVNQHNSTATGSGAGQMIYDIPGNYIVDSIGDMIMDMTMAMGEMGMKVKAQAKSSIKAKIL